MLAVFGLSGCSSSKPKFGPWHAFTYEHEGEQAVRHSLGEYITLNTCLNYLVAATKVSGASYFCGFNCTTTVRGGESCEKVMGNPRHFINGSESYIEQKQREHKEELGDVSKEEYLQRKRDEAYE